MSTRAQRENACHRHTTGMADAEPPGDHSQRRSRLRRAADKPDFRRSARSALNYHIGECNTCTESRAERLEYCFLRSESSCQALDPIDRITDFIKLSLDETARNKRIARIIDPAPQLSDFDKVDSVSDHIHDCPRFPDSTVRCPEPFLQLTHLAT